MRSAPAARRPRPPPMPEKVAVKPMRWRYDEKNREGDHVCCYSDLRRMQADHVGWNLTRDLDTIIEEIAESWTARLREAA